jgi:hypothetical protein
MAAFQDLRPTLSGPPFHQHVFDAHPPSSRKRRHSDTEPPSVGRTLHPKPANGDPGASFASTTEAVTPARRGRPPKAVIEARKAEAAARGPIYPPLKPSSRKSMGAAPTTPMSLVSEAAGPASEPAQKTEGSTNNPPKKRRGRPPKLGPEEPKKVQIIIV